MARKALKKTPVSEAPKAIGPYSQWVQANGFVFVSGQIAIDPKTGLLIDGSVARQAKQVFENMKAILAESRLSLHAVVKVEVFLKDMNDFSAMNEVYASYFFGKHLPARQTIQAAALPKNALVEISCIAAK
ncbi:MAG: Rid family detoxifying hydrolase [archaeon]